jgi:hypothetical protein
MGWALVGVTAADLASVRRPTSREAWSISPLTKLVLLESAKGVLEWAVPGKQSDWAVEQVLWYEPRD